MVSTPAELWAAPARGFDQRTLDLLADDGRYYRYDALLQRTGSALLAEADPATFQPRFDRCQRAIHRLADIFAEAAPDLAIIVGDDQHEVFGDSNMPAVSVYWGDTILNTPRRIPDDAPPSIRASAWAFGLREQTFPVAADLGRQLIEGLMDRSFDVAHSRGLSGSEGIGHAFTFVYHRIMRGQVVPHVPIMLNTYYPPNQPRPSRCYALGEALKQIVEAWPDDRRVAVIASGGLSHFVVNQPLDQQVIGALQSHDAETLRALPRAQMHSGNSEILNWVVAGGALTDLAMELIDYVPCYRTPAGTGVGMTFAAWR
jgi:hypothetical protein